MPENKPRKTFIGQSTASQLQAAPLVKGYNSRVSKSVAIGIILLLAVGVGFLTAVAYYEILATPNL